MSLGEFRNKRYRISWKGDCGSNGVYYDDIDRAIGRIREVLLKHGNVVALRRGTK